MRNAVVETVVFAVLLPLLLFGSAGTFAWPMAWALIAVFALFSIAGFLLLPAELIVERSRLPADARPEDLLISGLAILLMIPATAIVSGLDVRWHWSPALPAAVRGAALALFTLGYAVSLWAAWANKFFSAVVRIQSERGHHVISHGPYAVVRHPGYAGPMSPTSACRSRSARSGGCSRRWPAVPASSCGSALKSACCAPSCRVTPSTRSGCAGGCCRTSGESARSAYAEGPIASAFSVSERP